MLAPNLNGGGLVGLPLLLEVLDTGNNGCGDLDYLLMFSDNHSVCGTYHRHTPSVSHVCDGVS